MRFFFKIGCISILVLTPLLSTAQVTFGSHYKIKSSRIPYAIGATPSIYYTADNRSTASTKFICAGTRTLRAGLKQDASNPSIVKIEFWGIITPDPCSGSSTDVNSTNLQDANHYFYYEIPSRLTLSNPQFYISIPYSTWEVGAATVPFKVRLFSSDDTIKNDVTTGVGAGIYFGRKWGRTRFYADPSKTKNAFALTTAIFGGPVSISVTPKNTRNRIKRETSAVGTDFGIAFLASYSDINFGILGGLDIPIGGSASEWIFAYKPWIGFGFGYKIGVLGDK